MKTYNFEAKQAQYGEMSFSELWYGLQDAIKARDAASSTDTEGYYADDAATIELAINAQRTR